MLEKLAAKKFLPQRNNKKSNAGQRSKRNGKGVRGRGRSSGRGGATTTGRVMMRSGTQINERSMPLFAARTTKRLRYASSGALSSTSGAVATYIFSVNGLFDPDITSTGHQPMGFDQMMVSYNHYYVTSARITVTFRNQTGNATPVVSISVMPDTTPITVSDRIVEFGDVNMTTLESKAVAGSVKTLQQSVSMRRIMGVDDVVDNSELRGDAASNPTEQTYFHVQTWNNDVFTCSINFDVVIDYTAIFAEPRVLTESERTALMQIRRMAISARPQPVGSQDVKAAAGRFW